ncbi:OLC1v1033013C1 [Oldenlandia corymbosa var. corymbosa]|uniref:L-gulonolactone oxidase n=1 Tax=Oldenlandia corymbosa var. corymbosa TaxID=529605 RepID=A0AAV1CNS6_OLDCO|nr:OLC1v1033013C1 [Oldenlandia corymbosa var. corymbosa]
MKIVIVMKMSTGATRNRAEQISEFNGSPPPDPVKCSNRNLDCTIENAYGSFPDRSICHAAEVAYPTTEEELISIVANATMLKMKMKVATKTSHSIPKLMCPGGENGLIISTKLLDQTVSVDQSELIMTVQSGMMLRDLISKAAAAGMALPYAPYWLGVTVGGMLGTGAHGSSLWGSGSAVHDSVVQLRIVSPAGPDEGYAKVRTLESGDPQLDAAKVSLGVLGVISQVTLKLQPNFKRSLTLMEKNDSGLGDEALTFGKDHEFADFSWFPSQKKVVYRLDDRVPTNISGTGLDDFFGFRSTPSLLLAAIRTTEVGQELISSANGKCISGAANTLALKTLAYGYTNDGILFTGYPIVGYHNHLQASGSCLNGIEDALFTACPWDPRVEGVFFFQTSFSISLSKVKGFIEDIKSLVELEPKALCGINIYNGILMRYVTTSSAYLGKQEDGLDFDITYYRSKDPTKPRLYEDVLEEIEQMAMFKYGALPHWGKNRNVAFIGAIEKYTKADEFLKVKNEYDPDGLFSSEWTDQILGLKDGISIVRNGCALEGLCICSQDIHCAPESGYFCRPGRIYKEARVCRFSSS